MTRQQRIKIVDKILMRHVETPHTPRNNGDPCQCDLCIMCDETLALREEASLFNSLDKPSEQV